MAYQDTITILIEESEGLEIKRHYTGMTGQNTEVKSNGQLQNIPGLLKFEYKLYKNGQFKRKTATLFNVDALGSLDIDGKNKAALLLQDYKSTEA